MYRLTGCQCRETGVALARLELGHIFIGWGDSKVCRIFFSGEGQVVCDTVGGQFT